MIFFPAEGKNKFLLTQLTVNFRVKKNDGRYLKNNWRQHFLKTFIPYHSRYQLLNQEATICHYCSMCKYHLPHLGIGKDHSSQLDAVLFVECHISARGCLWWSSYKALFRTFKSNIQGTNNSDHDHRVGCGELWYWSVGLLTIKPEKPHSYCVINCSQSTWSEISSLFLSSSLNKRLMLSSIYVCKFYQE